jgi:hypothetical protein
MPAGGSRFSIEREIFDQPRTPTGRAAEITGGLRWLYFDARGLTAGDEAGYIPRPRGVGEAGAATRRLTSRQR